MLLETFMPYLPSSVAETWIFVGAGISILFLVYAVFIEKEHRQDLIRLIGTGGLLIYAIYIHNVIFTVAMAALAVASLVEFVEIMLGLHKHSPEDLQRYKTFVRTKHLEPRQK
ncbi:MAG: hypothetical protein CO030_01975 [Candidatus Magasanikbacteria bacterium CG_4_9_14_0_2_um_filter_42_11]|uniref:Uncharacterized protein n=1 Tax=Candidatus Magasanikbacteria bacterium CG_4_9_14_0_2_um_filter_42_11 TaxID=1974643 RepID=A0A2M8FA41_9BACT|nr:MAG: hypothetical protein COY70_04860 [Candidatus Magasanikbacteria bacterium CG_4_10_14_0_8_um_filter_42_12]PJC52605.1 MAG: hypothetical protein CO030_01975 [Candidatus Magasanikbacteria bacterium CG_4_9_14_0_2_um_filter_42_11]